jgi:hypothetical protein
MRCTLWGNAMKASEKIWWTKAGAALVLAVAAIAVQQYFNVEGSIIFMAGSIVYMVLSDVTANMNGLDRNRGLKIGLGVFFFTWLMVWVLLYTLFQTIF